MEEGKSLAVLLGNEKKRLTAGAGVGIQETQKALVEKVGAYLDQGYTKIKMKIKPGCDIKRIAAVRKAYPDISLMVDANNAYGLDDIHTLKAMDDFNLLVIEQPLEYDDIIHHATLQRQLETPVGLDESIQRVYSARIAVELNACRSINIKQSRVGGLNNAKQIHDICMQGKIGVWCGGMMETGIGRAVLLALSGLPNFIYPMDIGASDKYFTEDIVEPPFKLNPDGTIDVPQKPGLGVEVNEELLKRYIIHKELLSI
jgi:O-succinylbenzoate synthase